MADFVFVDDRQAEIPISAFESQELDVVVVSPEELSKEKSLLESAYVFLVDLNLEDWHVTHDLSLTEPSNGLDVASIIRSRFGYNAPGSLRKAVAVCLYSGDFGSFQSYPSGLYRQHALARFLELEWVFEKATNTTHIAQQCVQLRGLRESIVFLRENEGLLERPREFLARFLAVSEDAPETVWEDIETSRPPVGESAKPSSGLSVVRWFLHRILPYPTFLVDRFWLATRCRIAPKAIDNALAKFERARYSSLFEDFLETRWWRYKVEQVLWDATGGHPFDAETLAKALEVEPDSRQEELVLCVDENYSPETEALVPMGDAVRVAPEDWPVFAEPAWMRKSLIEDHQDLKNIVLEADLGLVT